MEQWSQGHTANCSSTPSSTQEFQPENDGCPCSVWTYCVLQRDVLADVLSKDKPGRHETLPLKCWRLICPGAIFSFKIPPKATFSDPNWLSVSLQGKHTWSIAHVNIACNWCNFIQFKNPIQGIYDKRMGLTGENSSYFPTFHFIFKPRKSKSYLKVTFLLKMLQICAMWACAVCVKCVSVLSLSKPFCNDGRTLARDSRLYCIIWQFLFAAWGFSFFSFLWETGQSYWTELLDSKRCGQAAARSALEFISIFHLLIEIATIPWEPTMCHTLCVSYMPLTWCWFLATLWTSDIHTVLSSTALLSSCRLRPSASFMEPIQLVFGFLFSCCLLIFPAWLSFPKDTASSWRARCIISCWVLFVCLVIIHYLQCL